MSGINAQMAPPADAEHEPSQQHGANRRRQARVPQPRAHREQHRSPAAGAVPASVRFHETSMIEQPDIRERVHQERRRCTGDRDDHAADGRPRRARQVVGHRVERDRRRDVLARHLLAHRRLPRRPVQRRAAADQERQREQRPGRDVPADRPSPPARRKRASIAVCAMIMIVAPVPDVRERARRQRQQHDRQRRRRLHQRHVVRRRRERRHQPRRADGLDEAAEVRNEAGRPDLEERARAKRRKRGGLPGFLHSMKALWRGMGGANDSAAGAGREEAPQSPGG